MLSLLIDFINEYQEATNKGKYIGNERFQEFQEAFNEELEQIIDNRIKQLTDKSN